MDILQVPSAFVLVEPIVVHFSPFLVCLKIVTFFFAGSIAPLIENLVPKAISLGTGFITKPGWELTGTNKGLANSSAWEGVIIERDKDIENKKLTLF